MKLTTDERTTLLKKLLKLLKTLKFTHIRVNKHLEYPSPERIYSEIKALDYTPTLAAQKNDVIYYFELILDNINELTKIKEPLKVLNNVSDKRWDTAFVVVTLYGNKDFIKESCQTLDLNVTHIWEI